MFILGIIGLLICIVILLNTTYGKALKKMQGMTITMFFAMNIGITAGILFGATFKGDLFLSTIYSILVGVIAGALCGMWFGMISILEGIMAGMMAGMMGAMLGEMTRVEDSVILIQLFLFFSICTIYLILIFKTSKSSIASGGLWFIKPVGILILTSILLLGGHSAADTFKAIPTNKIQKEHHNEQGNK